MSSKFKAMVLSCIDPRFQTLVYNHLRKKRLKGKYSSFTIAGASIGVTAPEFKKWHKTFWDNIDTSIKIHKIKKLIVINHKDCGAAKMINNKKKLNSFDEIKIHKEAFIKIKKQFKKKYKNLKIETYLISLDKSIKKFN